MKKKFFTFLFAMLASIGIVEAVDVTQNGINYSLSESTEKYYSNGWKYRTIYEATVQPPKSGYKYSGDIVIVSSIYNDGHYYTTTDIWHKAFQNCKNITSITLPYTIENIYDEAFDGCTGITSIDIPTSVTYIGYNAFYGVPNINFTGNASGSMGQQSPWGAKNLNKYVEGTFVYDDETKAKLLRCATSVSGDLYIPSSVKIIGESSFYDCYQITSIHIPSSVTEIGANAFLGCSNTIVYTNTPFVQCGEYAFGLDNSMTVLPDVDYKTDTNFVLCRRYDPVPFFTVIEEGSFVDTAFTETGDYTFTSIANTPATVHVVNGGCFIQLPDTTVCYGEWVSLSGTYQYKYVDEFEPSQWSSFYNEFPSKEFITSFMYSGSQTDYYQWFAFQYFWENYTANHGECDEQTRQGFETWYKSHFHEYASSCPDGAECMKVSSDGEKFYTSGSLTRTYINRQGCDSVVSRNVIVSKTVAPKIIATPEQDTFNSGTIRIYNKYCTGSEYYEGQYNYFYQYAEYDYFTINGKKYDFSSAIEGEYNKYYHPDGIRVIDEPSTVIDNLSAGEYHIVFYSSCDSIAEDITIETKGIEIDGIYYIIQYSGLKVIYRGSSPDEYDEYSGNVIIPDSAIYNGEKLPIVDVDENAFHYSPNLSSITFNSILPSYNRYLNVQVPKLVIYVPFGALETYKYMIHCYYYNYDYSHYFGYKYSYVPAVHVIHLQNVNKETSSTASIFTIGNAEDQKHISSCGVVNGEEYPSNVIEYTGLNPNKEYTDIQLYVKTIEGDSDVIVCSFTTPALELTTKPSKPVSGSTAILLAQTNMADIETSCGFEWKRTNAPDDMQGTLVYAPLANGLMAGRLKGLQDNVYYKYRAFYKSAEENMYYGDWQYIFTGDGTVEFEPMVYTYAPIAITEDEATIKGCVVAGAEEFSEQGFEYWAESHLPKTGILHRLKAASGEHHMVPATGTTMSVTLTELEPGTVYKYRTYAKIGNQVFYGAEMSFTTKGEYDDTEDVENISAASLPSRKILRNGRILILRGNRTYTLTGQLVSTNPE